MNVSGYYHEWWGVDHPDIEVARLVDREVKAALDFYVGQGWLSMDGDEISLHECVNGERLGGWSFEAEIIAPIYRDGSDEHRETIAKLLDVASRVRAVQRFPK